MTTVHVPFGENQAETATLLLAAVEEIDGVEPGAVAIDTGTGTFTAPEEVAKKAGLDTVDPAADFQAQVDEAAKTPELPSQPVTQDEAEQKQQADAATDEAPKPAKKAAAKKATAKKSTSKGK